MPLTDNPAAQVAFKASISQAPQALKEFFDLLVAHFGPRSDRPMNYTFSNSRKGQMRIWARWQRAKGGVDERVTATLYWQSRKKTVFVRCLLTPEELRERGFDVVDAPKAKKETLKCDLWLDENDWTNRVSEIIAALEASANKAGK